MCIKIQRALQYQHGARVRVRIYNRFNAIKRFVHSRVATAAAATADFIQLLLLLLLLLVTLVLCVVLYPHILLIPYRNTIRWRCAPYYPCDTPKPFPAFKRKISTSIYFPYLYGTHEQQSLWSLCVRAVRSLVCRKHALHMIWCASPTSISIYRRCATVIRLFINVLLLIF